MGQNDVVDCVEKGGRKLWAGVRRRLSLDATMHVIVFPPFLLVPHLVRCTEPPTFHGVTMCMQTLLRIAIARCMSSVAEMNAAWKLHSPRE